MLSDEKDVRTTSGEISFKTLKINEFLREKILKKMLPKL